MFILAKQFPPELSKITWTTEGLVTLVGEPAVFYPQTFYLF